MTRTIPELPVEADREREIAKARANVIRRAEAQGVQAFSSPEDFAGDAAMTADFDVDKFLQQVHADRHRRSIRSDD